MVRSLETHAAFHPILQGSHRTPVCLHAWLIAWNHPARLLSRLPATKSEASLCSHQTVVMHMDWLDQYFYPGRQE